MTITDILIYIISFLLIWVGSGFTVQSIQKISALLKFPTFIVSFIILGAFTSLPEIFLVFKSTAEGTPEISAGNLIGGVAVVYFFLVPFIALLSGGIRLSHEMNPVRLFLTVLVTTMPFLFLLDGHSSSIEAIIMILSFFILITIIRSSENTHPLLYKSREDMSAVIKNDLKVVLHLPILFLGIFLIFISSNLIVDKTLILAGVLNLSPFVVSLLVISLGTNLPELTVGIRSVIMKEKDVAVGGYLGSALANTWIFGILSVLNQGNLYVANSSALTSIIFFLGIIVFYHVVNSKKFLSRNESILLLIIFFFFGIGQIL